MAKKVVINSGFITNSSSCVYHFDLSMLEHPDVQEFLRIYDIKDGFVGSNVWNRSACESIVLNPEQKESVNDDFRSLGWSDDPPQLSDNDSEGAVIYGDEYSGLASVFVRLLQRIKGTVDGDIQRTDCFN